MCGCVPEVYVPDCWNRGVTGVMLTVRQLWTPTTFTSHSYSPSLTNTYAARPHF